MKRRVPVETFLEWAVREELVHEKRTNIGSLASAWARIDRYATLGAMIDSGANWLEHFDDRLAPDADAMAAASAMRAWCAGFDAHAAFAGLDPLADWAACDAMSDVRRVLANRIGERSPAQWREHAAALLWHCAYAGRAPEHDCPMPVRRMVSIGGKPAWFMIEKRKGATGAVLEFEVDGYDKAKARPRPGAYRKYEFAVSPVPAMLGRADFALWRMAMAGIADALGQVMMLRWEVAPPATPWPAWAQGFAKALAEKEKQAA
jgi:hypothetical protein